MYLFIYIRYDIKVYMYPLCPKGPFCKWFFHGGFLGVEKTLRLVKDVEVQRLRPESLSQRSWRFQRGNDVNDPNFYDMNGRHPIFL